MFKCDSCLKRFARKESLIKHKCKGKDSAENSETSQVKESCEFCGKEFANRKYLIQHLAAHTGNWVALREKVPNVLSRCHV